MRTWFLILFFLASQSHAAEDEDFGQKVRDYILAHPEIIVEALSILSERERKAEVAARIADLSELFSDPPALGMGAPEAPVQVVEFFDYRCVPCKTMHPALEAYVADNPDIRIEMRHLPILSPGSERAARFALATRLVAGDAAYARVHKAIWAMKGPLNAQGFERVAQAEDLDFEAISKAMDTPEVTTRITYNRDAAIALEILGTPAFVTADSVSFGQADVEALGALWRGE